MTATADEKAGWCAACRGDRHTMCGSPSCQCPNVGRRNHPARPADPAAAHGTYHTYVKGCRCDDCREASREYKRRQRGADLDGRDDKERTYQQRRLRAVQPDEQPTPVIELVAEDPPDPPRKLTLVDQVLELVHDGGLEPGKWFRVAVMPSSRSAKTLVTRLGKHELTARMGLEWKPADVRVFVRGPQRHHPNAPAPGTPQRRTP